MVSVRHDCVLETLFLLYSWGSLTGVVYRVQMTVFLSPSGEESVYAAQMIMAATFMIVVERC